ncbi:MAG: hypothetical protein MI685_11065 [Chlorobiales bacterium]|nr:hypothetical protein [Chlorobiales bacterium]
MSIIDDYVILWFGESCLKHYFSDFDVVDFDNVIDVKNLDFNNFKGYMRNYGKFIEIIENEIEKVDYLFTCYDTDLGFEVVRHLFSVSWDRVGIIEDGISNYYPHAMPKLCSKIIKSIINKFQKSFFLDVSKYNLGGNSKVGIVSTICPEHVYLHKNSKAKILNIRDAFIEIIDGYEGRVPDLYKSADVIFFLSAVLNYKRMTTRELVDYLKYVRSNDHISKYKNFVLKPHPREDLVRLRQIIIDYFGDDVKVAENVPIEIYIKSINPKCLAGMPTTAMLNHYIINPRDQTEYVIFFDKTGPYKKTQINVIKKVIRNNLYVYYYDK